MALPTAARLSLPFRKTPTKRGVLSLASCLIQHQVASTVHTKRSFGSSRSKENAWADEAGPKAVDLRSDVTTIPTKSMLAAIQSCTHQDDVYQEDTDTSDLESKIANLAGKDAGLFVLSGTMGNQLSLRSLLVQPPYGVLCDRRSHVLNHEAGAISSLTGAQVQPVMPVNGMHLTLEDIQAEVVLGNDIHTCPTRVISLENTLHGMIMPHSEIHRISEFARKHGIRMHLDGTRLWEAAAAGAGTIAELCAPFDTVNLCFTKGLGAPVGGMIVGSNNVIQHARWTRKAIGGGMRQPGLLTVACRVAVDEIFGNMPNGQDGLLPTSHDLARSIESLWKERRGTLRYPVHTNICWLDLEAAGCSEELFIAICKQYGLKSSGGRLVTHYQLAQNRSDVLQRLQIVFTKVLSEK